MSVNIVCQKNKKNPHHYNIVVKSSHGKKITKHLGYYNNLTKKGVLDLNNYKKYTQFGAKASRTVKSIVKKLSQKTNSR